MTLTSRLLVSLVLLAWAAATGCVSLKASEDARFFYLEPLSIPGEAPQPPAEATLVGVLPVRVPGYLDRPQLVTQAGGHEVEIHEFERWAEPLERCLTRTLAENLAVLLPEHLVLAHPWKLTRAVRHRVLLEVSDFSRQTSGEVRLVARWTILPGDQERPLDRGSCRLTRTPSSAATGEVVAAMSELLAELSREIAEALRALPAEEESAEVSS